MSLVSEEMVLQFISEVNHPGSGYDEENSLLFAQALHLRFGGFVYYIPVPGKFVTLIDGAFYNANGKVDIYGGEKLIPLEGYRDEDDLHFDRIVKQCLLHQY